MGRRVVRWGLGAVAALLLAACAQQWRLSTGDAPPAATAPDALRVATLNVHYIDMRAPDGPWSVAGWEARRGPLDALVKEMDADIVAFQEMESFAGGDDDSVNLARSFLLAQNPGYRAAATGDWRNFPSTQPVFYRPDRLTLADQGWFFFSDTPDQIYSRTFDGSWPAFASWAEFETRRGQRFRVVNVHLEYRSASNRRLSAALIRDRIAPLVAGGMPVILAGDLNALHGWATMDLLEEAGLRFPRVPGATWHMNHGLHLFGAIDHIGLSPDVALAAGPFVLQRKRAGDWPTDHHPVIADLLLP
ncbi:endonuclease/exonuclease/phosphatase family protein [Salipiger sp.]|uniref:endonuclease/exonuclease/phosphatase family protein n=1 Tax=Salipiger sp. TaxID=2078585 RepID=UPI003A978EBE